MDRFIYRIKKKKQGDKNMTEQFKELQRRVAVLNELLKDPQYGLMSWCESYAEQMKWIADYWKNN